jgi:hypothetical protein
MKAPKSISIPFEYKPNLTESVERHRRLWTRRMPNEILGAIMAVDELSVINPDVQCPDVSAMFSAWEHNFRLRRNIDDDCIPVARVSFGSAAFGAFLGADITFDLGIGWAYPFIEDYQQVENLNYDPQNEWILRQQSACEYFVEKALGLFPLCEMETIDGLNLVEALRGSLAYTDVYDYPDGVHHLLKFSSDFNIRFIEMQRELLSPNLYYQDGVFSMFWNWLPGKAPWMSVDAYGNCSRAVFREFGAPYLQRMIDHFDGGWMHLHSHATHLLPEIVKLKKVLGIGIIDDLNATGSFDQLSSVRPITGDIPLQIDCSCAELENAMNNKTLPGGVMYLVREGVRTVDQANRLMDRVRGYRSVD